ncbi:hypothetical protein GCM10011376_38960 [Nocardioides flavus (ex Wang et al. 2016)]|uniref:Uncharacterized protein n=1 Tax=Nocardioides flavus (ex Wang et al. 2016) TaxID=2058780 RepID=A0ABQ3HP29_9ACTN|nr:hypothetical protein [Nocardioides flavus (ex Wang et al. 2016)]GHE19286.1 hypothetical protein GCM10011376_38960 [Nocardioides flavus (ex Wang et al. 2016)]
MSDGSDFARWVDARWPDLVGGLEDDGVAPDDARLAVAEVLLASRRGWDRRAREEQVDLAVWAEVRERAGLAARPREPAPHAVRARDPRDGPEPWLAEAARLRSARRRRTARRGVVAATVVAVLAAGWAWWAAQPSPPEVREETNELPVAWYAEGELHLDEVVVELPGVEEFVADGDGVAARLRSGDVVRVGADGAVDALDRAPEALTEPQPAPAYLPPGRYDVRIQSVPLADGGWAHLIDSSRRDGALDAVRQSETGRRALVVCPTVSACEPPVTIVGPSSIRLR